MKKRKRYHTPAILQALAMGILLLAGCAGNTAFAEPEHYITLR